MTPMIMAYHRSGKVFVRLTYKLDGKKRVVRCELTWQQAQDFGKLLTWYGDRARDKVFAKLLNREEQPKPRKAKSRKRKIA